MNIIVLDFETYFDADYSLSRMTTESYVRDPRFKAHGCALYSSGRSAIWIDGPKLRDTFAKLRLHEATVLCHHAHFDGLILSHRYDVRPARWLDTLSMARYLYPREPASLEALAARFGLSPKSVPYDSMKGVRDPSGPLLAALAAGAIRDCELTWDIFQRMHNQFPSVEYPLIDLTVRMFVEPSLQGDIPLLRSIADRERLNKNERLYALGVGESDLASSAKFTALLEAEGVEVEMKQGKNGPIPALAKSDNFMQELLDHDDERVSSLAAARIDVKSTIAETRSDRLAQMASRGPLCIYLNYARAHTRRWSGGDDSNFQNLGRQSDIRRAVQAPLGYLLAAPDQSQGECRILNWLAGQNDVVERFRRGDDPYLPMASAIYGEPVVEGDPRRQVGKVVELASGYGMGAVKLERIMRQSKISFDPSLPMRGIDAYRATHRAVVGLWSEADDVLIRLHRGLRAERWRIFQIDGGRLYHPNGTWLDYTGLRWEEGEWRLWQGKTYRKMYGAKLIENIVQWLSRIVTAEAMIRFRAAGYSIVGMAHDDIWALCPDDGQNHKSRLVGMMSVTPTWAPGLPMAADCKIGKTYS